MVLVKSTPAKQRDVYELPNSYKKVWKYKDIDLLINHVNIMNTIWPDYIKEYGWSHDTMWVEVKKISGVTANKFPHSSDFMKKIYKFCLDNIKQTAPYAHYDWVLSNIIIDNDKIYMVDWDNVGLYSKEEILIKLHADLKSAFGEKFDPSSI
jgi:hypothetical protein